MFISATFILLIVSCTCAYHQLKPWQWALIIGVTLFTLTFIGWLNPLAFFLYWLLFIAAALFALVPSLRKKYVTGRSMTVLQKSMPTISVTENEALKSGDAWWEKDLFSGAPNWKTLLSYPKPRLTPEEQDFLDNQVETFCSLLSDWNITREAYDLPKKAWAYLQNEKFFGLVIPKEYGGLGFSALAHSTIVVKVATRSVSAAVNMMVPNSLGPGELLIHYGTSEQKDYYLPRLAAGAEIPCFALTGTDAGSDAGSITDSGVVCHSSYKGKETLGIRLNWDKRYITLAPVATVLGLAVHLYDPDKLLSEKVDVGITLCLIPTSHPGVEIGNRHLPMYMGFMNGPTRGKDVFIPLDWIIGGQEKAGKGWQMLMECLSIGRSISLPALSAACGKLAYSVTGAYARIRKQFNLPIGYFEGVEEILSPIAGYTYLLEAARVMTTGAVDLGVKPSIASAIAKYHMTEMSRKIIHNAMDIHGGHAIQAGPDNPLIGAYLAAPMSITVEGANILTRNLIIFGQGAVRCHPYLLREIELLDSATPQAPEVLDEFDRTLMAHIGFGLRNLIRSVWYGLSGGRLISTPPKKSLSYFYQQLTRLSSALALWSDLTLLVLGGNLKRRERISARLGDILSQLYLASSVLKYHQDQGEAADELPSVKWCIENCLFQAQTAFQELANNFPIRWLGKVLFILVFPFGSPYKKPSDALCQKLARQMLAPSALRQRLTKDIYLDKDSAAWSVQLEEAFNSVEAVDPLVKKFQNLQRHGKVTAWKNFNEQAQAAVKADLLTASELETLQHYEKLRLAIIKVAEFSPDLRKVVL